MPEPDPIWLDANVVARLANGQDPALENEVVKLRQAGHRLLLVPAANNELLNGNPLTMKRGKPVWEQVPSDASRVAIEKLKARLGITVDTSAATLVSSKRVGYTMQDHVPRPKNLAVPPSLDQISESDSLVLGQVKASAEARGIKNPVILTAETRQRGMISQASRYGVTSKTVAVTTPPVAPLGRSRLRNIARSANLRLIGGFVVGSAIGIAFSALEEWAADKFNTRMLERYTKELWPEVEKYGAARKRLILDELISSEKAYVVAKLRLRYYFQYYEIDGQLECTAGVFNSVKLDSLVISSKKSEGAAGLPRTEEHIFANYKYEYYEYFISTEATIPQEEIDQYRQAKQLVKSYEDNLKKSVGVAERRRIRTEIDKTYDWIDLFAGKVADFQPDKSFWTPDGCMRMSGKTEKK